MATAVHISRPRHVRINLSGTHLPDADLSFAQLNEADFRGSNLPRANFKGAKLCNAKFSSARLVDANFEDAELRGSDFFKCDLTRVSFVGATLDDANFEGALLDDAGLCGIDLGNANGLIWRQLLASRFDQATRLPEALEERELFDWLVSLYPEVFPRFLNVDGYESRIEELLDELNQMAKKAGESTIREGLSKLNLYSMQRGSRDDHER